MTYGRTGLVSQHRARTSRSGHCKRRPTLPSRRSDAAEFIIELAVAYHELSSKTMKPQEQYVLPVDTAKVAWAIFLKGNLCITISNTLGTGRPFPSFTQSPTPLSPDTLNLLITKRSIRHNFLAKPGRIESSSVNAIFSPFSEPGLLREITCLITRPSSTPSRCL